jgi:hypothetical protein
MGDFRRREAVRRVQQMNKANQLSESKMAALATYQPMSVHSSYSTNHTMNNYSSSYPYPARQTVYTPQPWSGYNQGAPHYYPTVPTGHYYGYMYGQ